MLPALSEPVDWSTVVEQLAEEKAGGGLQSLLSTHKVTAAALVPRSVTMDTVNHFRDGQPHHSGSGSSGSNTRCLFPDRGVKSDGVQCGLGISASHTFGARRLTVAAAIN